MSEPLHLPPDSGPETEQIRLGDQTLELDKDTARIVRDQFESLAAQYGAQLEQYRAQAMQSIGTNQPPPMLPQPIPGIEVPDPDLLFQNKGAWTEEFGRSLEGKLGSVRQESAQMVQGALSAMQQELARRDAMQAAKATHDKAMEDMLERRGLSDHRMIVQAVYNQQYDKLKHQPLELALDRVGMEAEAEINRIRSGENWQLGPAQTQTGVAPKPPKMLRTVQRAAPRPAPAPNQDLESPGGGLKPMGMIIRKHQLQRLGSSAA